MPDVWLMVALGFTTLFGFTVAGVAGFGGGVILMPPLLLILGPKEAVPIASMVGLMAAVSRTGLNWKGISWPVVKWNSIGAIPVSALASFLFVIAPPSILARVLGVILLMVVVYRHTHWGRDQTFGLRKFLLVGAGTSLVGGFLGTPGPVQAPFFLAYGLTGMAYVGTASVTTLLSQLPKLAVFRSNGLLDTQILLIGVSLGVVAFLGSFLGSWVAKRAPARLFQILVEVLLIVSGGLLTIRG